MYFDGEKIRWFFGWGRIVVGFHISACTPRGAAGKAVRSAQDAQNDDYVNQHLRRRSDFPLGFLGSKVFEIRSTLGNEAPLSAIQPYHSIWTIIERRFLVGRKGSWHVWNQKCRPGVKFGWYAKRNTWYRFGLCSSLPWIGWVSGLVEEILKGARVVSEHVESYCDLETSGRCGFITRSRWMTEGRAEGGGGEGGRDKRAGDSSLIARWRRGEKDLW